MRTLLALVITWMVSVSAQAQVVLLVEQGGDLQVALDAAQPGDTVSVEPGIRVYKGEFRFGPKAGTVTVRSSAVLPDRRITPADRALLPVIVSGVPSAAIVGLGGTNWRLDGLEVGRNEGGFGALMEWQDAAHIYLDRIYADIPDGFNQKRGIMGNGEDITLTRSWLAGFYNFGQDSQAFAAWDGAGPYTLTDNFLEAASENVMFGGDDSSSYARVPANVTIDRNHFFKRLSWKGEGKVIKTILEFKAVRGASVTNNLFENVWEGEGQNGYWLTITPRNQEGRAPWSSTEDIFVSANRVIGADRGVNILGYSDELPSGRATGIRIVGNDVTCTMDSWALQIGSEAGTVEYSGNIQTTCTGVILYLGNVWPQGEVKRAATFAVEQLSLFNNGPMWYHSDIAVGEAALKAYAKVYSLTGPIGDPPPPPPPPPPPKPCVAVLSSPGAVRWPGIKDGDKAIRMLLTTKRNCQVEVSR